MANMDSSKEQDKEEDTAAESQARRRISAERRETRAKGLGGAASTLPVLSQPHPYVKPTISGLANRSKRQEPANSRMSSRNRAARAGAARLSQPSAAEQEIWETINSKIQEVQQAETRSKEVSEGIFKLEKSIKDNEVAGVRVFIPSQPFGPYLLVFCSSDD